MVDNFYWLWDSALSKEFCKLTIAEADWNNQEEAKIGDGYELDSSYRKTLICMVSSVSPIGCVAQTYIKLANTSANWDYLIDGLEDIQIAKYEDNGFYNWHSDVISPNAGIQRKLSASIILSDPSEYEGGLLEFDGVDKQPELKQGSIIVFPSFIRHRVTPVTSGIRYSAVAWALGPTFK